jgi:hypothetical protein
MYCTLQASQDTRRGQNVPDYQNITHSYVTSVRYTAPTVICYDCYVLRNWCCELPATVGYAPASRTAHKGVLRKGTLRHVSGYYQNITLWFLSVLNVIIMSLCVIRIIF